MLSNRVTSLEELLTHFERTVGDLDGVVRHLHDRMDTLEGCLEAVSSRLRSLSEGESDAGMEVEPD